MTAKEMFEELGYWKNTSVCYDDKDFIYEKPSEDGDKVENALNWIHQCYDCYYKEDNDETSPFAYLREVINNELN